jgi:hypothetical protein
MNAMSLRTGLYALTLSLLATASGYAAAVTEIGGETGAGKDTARKSHAALAGASATRQRAAPHGAALAPKREVSALLGARSVLSKPAVAVARGYLLARPAADNRATLSDSGPAAARPVGAMSASALAGRASSGILLAARRSAAAFKPQGANGVIGGPRAAGPGSLGGPANSKTVINASINGSAPRRRS